MTTLISIDPVLNISIETFFHLPGIQINTNKYGKDTVQRYNVENLIPGKLEKFYKTKNDADY